MRRRREPGDFLDLVSPLLAGAGGYLGLLAGGLIFFLVVGSPKGLTSPLFLAVFVSLGILFSGLVAAALCTCNHRIGRGLTLGKIGAFIGGILGLVGHIPPLTLFLGSFASVLFPAITSFLFHRVFPFLGRPK